MRYLPSAFLTTRLATRFALLDLPALRGGSGWGRSICTSRAEELLKRSPHRLGGSRHGLEACDRPAVERHHGSAEALGDRDLAERPPSPADRDHGLCSRDDENVATLPHAGGQGYRQVLVRAGAMRLGQETDYCSTGRGRALARRSAHAAQATVDDDGAGLREQPADLIRRVELRFAGLGGSAYGDITARHRVDGKLCVEVHCPRGKGGEAEPWINRVAVPAASFASRELGRKRSSRGSQF